MKLIDLLERIDYEQQMTVCLQENDFEVSGNRASIMKMLSSQMLDSYVNCVSARDGNVIWVWLEEVANA